MFKLNNELLDNIKRAINPNYQLAIAGPNIQFNCGNCQGTCANRCTGGCKGSCQGSCTRSCQGHSR